MEIYKIKHSNDSFDAGSGNLQNKMCIIVYLFFPPIFSSGSFESKSHKCRMCCNTVKNRAEDLQAYGVIS